MRHTTGVLGGITGDTAPLSFARGEVSEVLPAGPGLHPFWLLRALPVIQ
ncbi:MAG: hypothetical protein ACKVPZ_12905 [Burkholderiaceae bacterium]